MFRYKQGGVHRHMKANQVRDLADQQSACLHLILSVSFELGAESVGCEWTLRQALPA